MNDNHDYINRLEIELKDVKDNRDYILEQLQDKKVECKQLESSLNESVARLNKSREELIIEQQKVNTYLKENIKLKDIIKDRAEEIIHLKAELYDVLKNFK